MTSLIPRDELENVREMKRISIVERETKFVC